MIRYGDLVSYRNPYGEVKTELELISIDNIEPHRALVRFVKLSTISRNDLKLVLETLFPEEFI